MKLSTIAAFFLLSAASTVLADRDYFEYPRKHSRFDNGETITFATDDVEDDHHLVAILNTADGDYVQEIGHWDHVHDDDVFVFDWEVDVEDGRYYVELVGDDDSDDSDSDWSDSDDEDDVLRSFDFTVGWDEDEEYYDYDDEYNDYDRYDDEYDGEYDGEYDEEYDDEYDGEYDDEYDGEYDEEYDDNDRYDDEYDEEYDGEYDDEDEYADDYSDEYPDYRDDQDPFEYFGDEYWENSADAQAQEAEKPVEEQASVKPVKVQSKQKAVKEQKAAKEQKATKEQKAVKEQKSVKEQSDKNIAKAQAKENTVEKQEYKGRKAVLRRRGYIA